MMGQPEKLILTLKVQEYRTHNNNYYRLLIPKKTSSHLGLQRDDKVSIQIKEVIRDGSPIVMPGELNLDGEEKPTY